MPRDIEGFLFYVLVPPREITWQLNFIIEYSTIMFSKMYFQAIYIRLAKYTEKAV